MSMNTDKSGASKTQWHTLLGRLLETLLSPVGIDVLTSVSIMSKAPEADILLLRRNRVRWSAEQKGRLPDGIRKSLASHVLVEFKYTESLNDRALRQAVGYDYFYQKSHELKRPDLQTVVASAKTQRKETLQRLGYGETALAGVYRSRYPLVKDILLLVLNELADTPYNAPIKCFASRKHVKQKAFTLLQHGVLPVKSAHFWLFIDGLWDYWFLRGGETMTKESTLTPERVTEMGKMLSKHILEILPLEERLAGLKPEERMAGLKPEERMAGLKPKERMAGLKPKERMAGLKPEERMAGLKPEEWLAGLKLTGLSIEDIEHYLRTLKKQVASTETKTDQDTQKKE